MDAAANSEEALEVMYADPNWIASMEAKEAKLNAYHAELAEAEEPLLQELRVIGFDVESAWNLGSYYEYEYEYESAVPILLEHFTRDYPDRVREGIARSLGLRSMRKELWPKLVEFYKAEPDGTGTKFGLACSLSDISDLSTLDEIIELAEDPANGTSRRALISAISRSRQSRALDALKRLSNDPEVAVEANRYLKEKERYQKRKKQGR